VGFVGIQTSMMKKLTTLFAFILIVSISYAQTNVAGGIYQNATYTLNSAGDNQFDVTMLPAGFYILTTVNQIAVNKPFIKR